MQMTYVAVVLLGLALAGCDNDETQRSTPEPSPTPSSEQPAEPRAGAMNPDRVSPAEPPAEKGTGLGTEFGAKDGEVVDPASGAGTGTTQ